MEDDAAKRNEGGEGLRPYLPFRNYAVFGRVMRDPGFAKELLERILRIEIEDIVYCNTEQVLSADAFSKGVRLDLYVKDAHRVFNVELQCGDYAKMGKRIAYYQTRISLENAPERGSLDYESPESFVIFLCVDDPFDEGIPRYDFEVRCKQRDNIVLDTGFHWLFLNAQAYDAEPDEDLRNVLKYVREDEVAPDDPFIERIDSEVHLINRDKEWVEMVNGWLTYEEHAEWRGFLRGEVEGEAKGRAEGLVEGEEKGEAKGEARLSALINKLLGSNRIADIERVTIDDAYRQQLFKEFGIA